MPSYARTYIQLVNQVRREGYATEKIIFVTKAYKLTVALYTGQFERAGNMGLTHGVGAASILCSLHAPAELVAAALLHNVYRNGDFGDGRKGFSDSRGRLIRNSLGEKVEHYLYGYVLVRQKYRSVPGFLTACSNDLGAFSDNDRELCLLALAEQLDHHLDLARIYARRDVRSCRNYIRRNGDVMVELADKLGFPGLAAELARTFRETVSAEVPQELLSQVGFDGRSVFAPKSYRRRLFGLF